MAFFASPKYSHSHQIFRDEQESHEDKLIILWDLKGQSKIKVTVGPNLGKTFLGELFDLTA